MSGHIPQLIKVLIGMDQSGEQVDELASSWSKKKVTVAFCNSHLRSPAKNTII
jgi:hypothetical protein